VAGGRGRPCEGRARSVVRAAATRQGATAPRWRSSTVRSAPLLAPQRAAYLRAVLAFARLGRAYHASLRPASTGARRSIVACWALLLVLSSSHGTRATSFSDRLGGTAQTQPIPPALSRANLRSLPLTSPSAGLAPASD